MLRHSTVVAWVPGSRKKCQCSLPQNGQDGGAGFTMLLCTYILHGQTGLLSETWVLCKNHADRVKTRCLAASSVLQVTEDYERRRVTPGIAPIDHAGILAVATRSVRPVRSYRAQGAGLLSPVRPSPPPLICQMRQG